MRPNHVVIIDDGGAIENLHDLPFFRAEPARMVIVKMAGADKRETV